MKLLRALGRWLRRPSAERRAVVWSEIEAALTQRRERRPVYQARARKGASTRIHNRFTGDRLTGAQSEGE